MDKKIFIENVSDTLRIPSSRRRFISHLALGAAGTAFSSMPSFGTQAAAALDAGNSTVSCVTGSDRRDMVCQVLKPLESEIKRAIRGKQIVIKPNLVGSETFLGITHPDAVRGLLDFLKPIYDGQVQIAESTGRQYTDLPGTVKHFHLYKYFPLLDEYNVKLVDLNAQKHEVQWLLGKNGHPHDIRVIEPYLNPNNYMISLSRMKTHNCLVVTLSAKNMLMGCPLVDSIRHDKSRMHDPGLRNFNYNMFLLAMKVKPQLAVLDGLETMEGNGPNGGTRIDHKIALASTDFVAADRVACQLMGVNFGDVGYLTYCADGGLGQGDLSRINIIGANPADHVIVYKMHDNFHGDDSRESQLSWKGLRP
ncbi:DUF362 domain-containing protein [Candidatus Latescibacterota bacterium]